MTETRTAAPIAAVVTERHWDRPVRSIVRRRHQSTEPVQTESVATRDAHIDPNCPAIQSGRIVARNVSLSSRDAGWACETCAYGAPVPTHTPTTVSAPEPTEKQVRFWTSLCDERGIDPVAAQTTMTTQSRWTKSGVSASIEKLLAQPKRQTTVSPPQSPAPAIRGDVPAGHYAIVSEGHNDLFFVRVDRPKSGRTYVKMIVGGHPDQNVAYGRVAGILDRIAAAGVDAAARLYGQEIGRCCRCNRSLTDETSRAAGIGPECAKHV